MVAAGGAISSTVSNIISGALTSVDILTSIFVAQSLTPLGVARGFLGLFQIGAIIAKITRAGQLSANIQRREQAVIRSLDGVLSILGRFNH